MLRDKLGRERDNNRCIIVLTKRVGTGLETCPDKTSLNNFPGAKSDAFIAR